jgi:hypothetical protein
MDGAQEVKRNRAAHAVSAKVDIRARRRVSFGELEENTCSDGRRVLAGFSLDEQVASVCSAGVVKT